MGQTSSTRLKKRGARRRLPFSKSCGKNKYNQKSLSSLIRDYVFCKDNGKIDQFVGLIADVDDYDPEEVDCTPLCDAVQTRSLEWTQFLLKKGADQTLACVENEDGSKTTASDIAWLNGDYDILLELILADGPFPQNFENDEFNTFQRLKIKAHIWRTAHFHQKIKNNLKIEVEMHVKKLVEKHAYDTDNKSALTVALESRNFEIYTFLRWKGFTCGIDKNHDDVVASLEKREKNALDREIQKYVQSPLIFNLLSNSRLGIDNDKKYYKKLEQYFMKLEEVTELRPILEIVAHDKNLTITFDFHRKDVGNLDLYNKSKHKARGRTYKKTNKILIAAKQNSVAEVLGTLSHELTHHALLKVYGNDFLPYHSDDVEQ